MAYAIVSVANGAAARIALRSSSIGPRRSSGRAARYSSTVLPARAFRLLIHLQLKRWSVTQYGHRPMLRSAFRLSLVAAESNSNTRGRTMAIATAGAPDPPSTAPAGDLGERRLSHDRHPDPARRRAVDRVARRPFHRPRARRRHGQRECCPRSGPPQLRGRRDRLRAVAARTGRERAIAESVQAQFEDGDAERSRSRTTASMSSPRCSARCSRRTRRPPHRACPRRQTRRQDRAGHPHARGLHRERVQGDRQARATARGPALPIQWGTEERLRELFGDAIAELRLQKRQMTPLPLATDLGRLLAAVLRSDAEGVRSRRRGRAPPLKPTCSRTSRGSIGPTTARWWCRANTSSP